MPDDEVDPVDETAGEDPVTGEDLPTGEDPPDAGSSDESKKRDEEAKKAAEEKAREEAEIIAALAGAINASKYSPADVKAAAAKVPAGWFADNRTTILTEVKKPADKRDKKNKEVSTFLTDLDTARDARIAQVTSDFAKTHGVSTSDLQAMLKAKAGMAAPHTLDWNQSFDELLKNPEHTEFKDFVQAVDDRAKIIKDFAGQNKLEVADVNGAIDRMRTADPDWEFKTHENDLSDYAKLDENAKKEADKTNANNKKFFEELENARQARLAAEANAAKPNTGAQEDNDNIGTSTEGKKKAQYNFWSFDITYGGAHSIMGQMLNALSQLIGGWAASYIWLAVIQVTSVVTTEVAGAVGLIGGYAIRPFFRTESDRMIARAKLMSGSLPLLANIFVQYPMGVLTRVFTGKDEMRAQAMRDAHRNFYNSAYTKVANLGGPLVGQTLTTIAAKTTAIVGHTMNGNLGKAGQSFAGMFIGKGDSETAPGLGNILYNAAKNPLGHFPGVGLLGLNGANQMTPGMRAALFGDPKLGIAGFYTSYYGVDEDGLLTDKNVSPAIKDLLIRLRANWPDGDVQKGKDSQPINYGKSRGVGNTFRNLWNYLRGKKANITPDSEVNASTSAPKPGGGGVQAELSQTAPVVPTARTPMPGSGVTAETSAQRPDQSVSATTTAEPPNLGATTAQTSAQQRATTRAGATISGAPGAAETSSAARLSMIERAWQNVPSLRPRLSGVSLNPFRNPFTGLYNSVVVRGQNLFRPYEIGLQQRPTPQQQNQTQTGPGPTGGV